MPNADASKPSPESTPTPEPEPNDGAHPAAPHRRASPVAAAAWLVLIGGVALVVLLCVSALVVYLTGLAARVFGVPELPVLLAFLGIVAIVVVGVLLGAVSRRIGFVGERLALQVEVSASEVCGVVDALPVAVIAAGPAPRGRGGRGPRGGTGGTASHS